MKKKLSLVLALLLALSVFVVACGNGATDTPEETDAPAAETDAPEEETDAPEEETDAAEEETEVEVADPDTSGEGLHIEVVSKGLQHAFWVNVQNGSQQAADDYGATMNFDGPATESDIQDQVNMLENAITAQPDAICLAALDVQSVMSSLENAQAAGIPIIGFDSGVPGAPEGSVYANASTDNNAAGGLAAEEIYKVIEEEINAASVDAPVRIAVLSQDAASESIMGRTQGFLDKMTELVGADLVSIEGTDVYAAENADAVLILDVGIPARVDNAESDATATSLLEQDNVVAIFSSNEFAAESMIRAGEALGGVLGNRAEDDSKIWAAGFDAGAVQKAAVAEGTLFGSVSQDAVQIGYKAVELAIKAANGEAVEDIDTGAVWYNAANLEDADIAPLIYD